MDKAIVNYMKENLGLDDMNTIQELYNEYLSTIKERLPSARNALEEKDFQALAKIAHAMKGCALNIGHEHFAAVAKYYLCFYACPGLSDYMDIPATWKSL